MLVACSPLFLAITSSAQEKKLKIHISVDLEGVVAVVTGEQLGLQGFEYNRFREFMTAEANAAIEAAIFIDYYASTSNMEGVRDHTISARTLTPEAAYEVIREKVKKAMARIKDFKPYKLKTPITLDLRFKNYRPSEILSYLPIVERTDSHSVRFVGKNMTEVSKFIEFLTQYGSNLEP